MSDDAVRTAEDEIEFEDSTPSPTGALLPVCPACESDLVAETCMGWKLGPGDHVHDVNEKTCATCSHKWFEPCPVCPWPDDRAIVAERYNAAVHAMQSAVAYKLAKGESASEFTPKHLRVGVNSAMVQHDALVHALVDKGLFTHEEYAKHVADAMEREVELYEKEMGVKFG